MAVGEVLLNFTFVYEIHMTWSSSLSLCSSCYYSLRSLYSNQKNQEFFRDLNFISSSSKTRIPFFSLAWKQITRNEGTPGFEPGTCWSAVSRSNHWAMYPSVSMIWLYMQVWTAAHIRLYQHILYRLASKFWTHWSNAVFSCLCLHCWCHFCLLSSLIFLSKSFQCHSLCSS